MGNLTNAQRDTLDQIKKEIPRFDFHDRPDLFEIKTWEVKETDYGCVIVNVVTGPIGDEGTLACVLCRRHEGYSSEPEEVLRHQNITKS